MSDNCCICFGEKVQGNITVVCGFRGDGGGHTICHNCVEQLYQYQNAHWVGGGKCPECRTDLLPLDFNHPFKDTLPPLLRHVVQISEDEETERIRLLNLPPPPPPPPEEEDSDLTDSSDEEEEEEVQRGRKRTMGQFTEDIGNIEDDRRRLFAKVHRAWTQSRSRNNTKRWRIKKGYQDGGDTWEDKEDYIVADIVCRNFTRDNKLPSRDSDLDLLEEKYELWRYDSRGIARC